LGVSLLLFPATKLAAISPGIKPTNDPTELQRSEAARI
jgi:hypothetical protein